MAVRPGQVIHFPAQRCAECPKRTQCTRADPNLGRSLPLHPPEPSFIQLRTAARTPAGRAALGQRIDVEHGLAGVRNRTGNRARYRSQRKNLLALRRYAALNNLSVVDQLRRAA